MKPLLLDNTHFDEQKHLIQCSLWCIGSLQQVSNTCKLSSESFCTGKELQAWKWMNYFVLVQTPNISQTSKQMCILHIKQLGKNILVTMRYNLILCPLAQRPLCVSDFDEVQLTWSPSVCVTYQDLGSLMLSLIVHKNQIRHTQRLLLLREIKAIDYSLPL